MGYQLWLPDALSDIGIRRLSVEPEWDRRGSINFGPRSVGAHHTGAANDITAMLRDGRPGLSGPLCNVEIRKSGEVRVIAAGRANHAGAGGFRGLTGNSSALGIEPTSDGKHWASAVLDVYPLVLAALCRGIGRDESWVWGHKEWTSRKWDPGALDMNWLRHQTGLRLRGGPVPTPAPIEEDEEVLLLRYLDQVYQFSGGRLVHIPWADRHLVPYIEQRYNLKVQQVSRGTILNYAGLDRHPNSVWIPPEPAK